MADQPRLAIVGAGLAGLTCAYRLQQRGLASTVYEASDRVGGRCWSAREFVDGQVGEHGGEFIDPSHERMIALAAELGLELEDRAIAATAEGTPAGTAGRGRIGGRWAPRDDGAAEFRSLVLRAADALEAAGDLRHDRAGDEARALDEMSGRDWIVANLDGGTTSVIYVTLETALLDILGIPIDELSAGMVAMLLAEAAGAAGESLEREETFGLWDFAEQGVNGQSHVRGGNDQIPHRLADSLPDGGLVLDSPLERLRRDHGGVYRLRFAGSASEVEADRVVLALPFTALREVDLESSGFSRRRRRCIEELPMGANTKLLLQFDRRLSTFESWPSIVVDDAPDKLAFWDTSLPQTGGSGLLTVFTGRKVFPADRPHGPASVDAVERGLDAAEFALPGARGRFNGHAWLDSWTDDPWTHGSYSAYAPGMMTRYFGFVGEPTQGVHFAGEHTSMEAQGYMEGAVESGERAAAEIAEPGG